MCRRYSRLVARIAITGGAGFLGARLAREILTNRPTASVILLDRVPPPQHLAEHPRVLTIVGDLRNTAPGLDADVVFHLAGAVSGECEADFDLGLSANLEAGFALLAACRAMPAPPVLVFASSYAVYGGWPEAPLSEVVHDLTLPTPRTSYGIQKYMIEQLVTDYTRKGFIDGRPVRLPTVSVRPGRPNGAASGFLSGIIREPAAGLRAVCPVPPETSVALTSPTRTIEGLMTLAAAPTPDTPIALNLPSITTTVAEMVDALSTVVGAGAAELIDWTPDPVIEQIVAGWPARVEAGRAARLGLRPDPDFESIVRQHMGSLTPSVAPRVSS
jgi:nucleoside-diphosphate-sugar epimerase